MNKNSYGDGGYPLFVTTSDGSVLHPCCADLHDKITGRDANWEDPDLTCDKCGERIESAYAEDFVGRKAILDGAVCRVALESTDGGVFDADRYDRIERVYRKVKAPLVAPYAPGVKAMAVQLRIRAWWTSDDNGEPLTKREPVKLVIDRVSPWGRVFRSRPWEYDVRGWSRLAPTYRLLVND